MRIEKARKQKRNKKQRRFIFRALILAILVAAVLFALITNIQKDRTIYKIGDEAPDFQLTQINTDNDVETIQLSELKGKGVMLNFWATYCPPCEREMPYMEELYPLYKEKGVEIVAVSLDATEAVIHQFIDTYDLTFPVVHDSRNQVMNLYKIGPIPTTYFINPDGEIVEKVEGALSLERLEGYFKQIQPIQNEWSDDDE